MDINPLWYLLWIAIMYTALSIKILGANQIGAIYWLGKEDKVVGAGPHWVPFGLSKMFIFPTEAVQQQFPGEPELVQRNDDIPLKEGEVRSIRINHPPADQALFYSLSVEENVIEEEIKKGPQLRQADIEHNDPLRFKAIKEDPLHGRITSEASVTITWHLDSEADGAPSRKVFQFVKNVGSIEEANNRLRDAVESALQDKLAKITHAESLRMKVQISEYIQRALQELVGEKRRNGESSSVSSSKRDHGEPWGIIIDDFEILQLSPGKRVNEALANAAAAKEQRRQEIEAAVAEAEKVKLVGEAKAQAAKAEADATAEAVRKIAEAMQEPGASDARLLDVLEKGFENANLIVAGEMLSTVTAARELLKENIGKKPGSK